MTLACPPPAYAADTRLTVLTTAELVLVGTLRLFALPTPARRRDDADWSRGLVAAGIGIGGISAFHGIFAVAAAAALRPLEVHRPGCGVLGADEARLLQLISLLQRHRRADALAILSGWVPAAAARIAIAPAHDFAATLTQARLRLPWRHAEAAEVARAVPFHADRGLLLMQ